MKKAYIAPCQKVADIEMESLIANSPSIAGGPGVGGTPITDDNMSGFTMDTKGHSLWDEEW